MKRLCSVAGCKAVVEVSPGDRNPPRCPAHPYTPTFVNKRRYSHQYINGKRIYTTPRWIALRNQYIAHQPLCEHCLKDGLIVAGHAVDHIVEIEDGGDPWDWNNLQHLCQPCHNRKTANEAVKRRRKKQNGGFGSLSDF